MSNIEGYYVNDLITMVLKIITVDDSEKITSHFKYILKDIGKFKWMGHAYSIQEAKELIKLEKPDVVIIDIELKEENGFDLLKFIKRIYPDVAVFMLSNTTDFNDTRKSKQMGAHYLIDKSFELYNIPNFLMALQSAKNTSQKLNRFESFT
ncbi:response regulator transcription factor [Gillisia limnaea]|uniref:Response regulator receiver protein n=1 Tax=Gillisia limnaea (strain DSM 15749 / LMG 21470 / R-8282) TaxID=865937 RepID=H2BW78_GILLR|nr:response regulator [Gillisia limnaea]EHQ04042.1 response regulator receiver protein [Gillisia limnaea DSM 15749]